MRPQAALFAAAVAIEVVAASPSSAAPPLGGADDVDLIPQGVLDDRAAPSPPEAAALPPAASRMDIKLFVEEALTLSTRDGVLVPYPPPLPPRWQERASLDAVLQGKPIRPLTFVVSDRLNVYAQEGRASLGRDTLRNDLREAYVAWQPHPALDLEVGRINVRNGAALGFNPTDFFRARSLVGQASLDPSVIRQNRLGALMIRGQALWSSGSASLAFAPRLASPSPVIESAPLGADPHLGATNGDSRALATLSLELLDLSPQLLGDYEPGRAKIGLHLSRPVGGAVIVYAEWAGGPEQNLIARAIAFGRQTGTLPEATLVVPPTSRSRTFRNDVAAGASWAVAAKLTVNLEYHFHQAGLGRGDWARWFDLGGAPGAPAALTNELWYVRAYANDQQEPLTRHQLFARVSWPRALVNDLELSAFAFLNVLDGSVLAQAAASYYLARRWTASVFLSGNLGAARSERGSFPERASAIFQLTLYL